MNMNKLNLKMEQVFGGNSAILIGQAPLKEYKDGKSTDNVIGMRFSVACFKNCFDTVTVKVEGAKALNFTDDEIAEACATLNPMFVTFDGFQGKPYSSNSGGIALTCSAKTIRVISKDEALNELDVFGGDN